VENKERFRKANSIVAELIIELEAHLSNEIILNDEFIDSLWEIQSNIEHSILMIKLCLNDDVVFSPQQDSQITEIKEIVQESLKAIKNSLQHMGNDEHVKALNDLRYGGHLIKNTLAKIRRKKITY
tara:strand:- start:296 stop:673 length:378 start_codon:yes stop_codon:yes gene_type:complete